MPKHYHQNDEDFIKEWDDVSIISFDETEEISTTNTSKNDKPLTAKKRKKSSKSPNDDSTNTSINNEKSGNEKPSSDKKKVKKKKVDFTNENTDDLVNLTNVNKTKNRPIEQFDLATGNVVRRYKNIRDAGKTMEIRNSLIYKVVSGKRKTSCGFGWRYVEGETVPLPSTTPGFLYFILLNVNVIIC